MRARRRALVLGLATLALLVGGAARTQASIIIYSGADPGVGPGGPRPNSDAAALAFDLAAGTSQASAIPFEGGTPGNFTTLAVAFGVFATLSGQDAGGGIVDTPTFFGGFSPVELGYNTTPGGSQFVGLVPILGSNTDLTLTFTFLNPISAFGAYLTGTNTDVAGTFTLEFDDGSSQILLIPKNPAGGGVQFFGFVDAGASITSVTLREVGPFDTRDIIGVDDVRYAPTDTAQTAVPEPASLALLALGGIGLAAWRRRQKHVTA